MNRRGYVSLGVAATLVSGVAGCATNADLDQVRRNQQQARRVIADQTVAIEELRRRLEMVQASIEDGGGRRPADAGRSDAQWRRSVEQRLTAIERGAAGVVAPTPQEGVPGAAVAPAGMPPATAPAPAAPLAPLPGERGAPAAAPAPVAAPAAAGGGSMAADAAREEASLEGTRAGADYRGALALVRQGNCKEAIPQLRAYVRKDIKSPWADNAQYWIGRCFHAQADYNRAVMELYDVLLKFPTSERVPAALLTLADSFADSGDDIDARLTLKKLLSDHPQSEEAAAARKRLQALGD